MLEEDGSATVNEGEAHLLRMAALFHAAQDTERQVSITFFINHFIVHCVHQNSLRVLKNELVG